MKDSPELFQLINTLSGNEKRYFKMFSSLQNGDKNYMKLFDVLERMSGHDESEMTDGIGEKLRHLGNSRGNSRQNGGRQINRNKDSEQDHTDMIAKQESADKNPSAD